MNFLNLKAVLSLNGSGFALGLKRAESASKSFAREIKGEFARAFGTAAITAYAVKLVNMADNVIDLSEQLGISTKALQEWQYAAKKSGATIEQVAKFLDNLGVAREKALGGDQKSLAAFRQLGIGVDDLQTSTIDQLGRKVSNSIKGGNLEDLRKSLREVGGEVGKLIPMMRDGIDELSQEAHDFNRILGDETLEGLTELRTEVLLLADSIAGPLAKAMAAIRDPVREMMSGVTAPIAAISAYIGARSGGASPGEALEAAAQADAHERTVVTRRKERRAEVIRTREELSNQLPTITRPTGIDDTIKRVVEKAARESTDRPQLNSWQQMGAAVRFNPENMHARETAKSTAETSRKMDKVVSELEKLTGVKFSAGMGGFE